MSKWICSTCGEAEGCDACCVVEVWAGEPECCPINGEDAEWTKKESEVVEDEE